MPGDYVDEWIRPDAKPEKLVQAAMTELVYEKVMPASDVQNDGEQLNLFE